MSSVSDDNDSTWLGSLQIWFGAIVAIAAIWMHGCVQYHNTDVIIDREHLKQQIESLQKENSLLAKPKSSPQPFLLLPDLGAK